MSGVHTTNTKFHRHVSTGIKDQTHRQQMDITNLMQQIREATHLILIAVCWS